MQQKQKRTTGRRVAMTYVYQSILLELPFELVSENLIFDEGFLSLDSNTQLYIKSLCEATLKNKETVLLALTPFLKEGWRFERLSKVEQAILYLGGYELLHSDIPTEVLIDEYVNLSKRFCDATSYKFINAVLDKIR